MSPRQRTPPPTTLSKDAFNLLKKLAKGATLKATRTYPHPHRFECARVTKKDGASITVTSVPQPASVSALVQLGYLTATPKGTGRPDGNRDQSTDIIEYTVSVAGRVFLADGNKPDLSQQEMFGGAA